jgi:hypothetical protein
VVRGSGILHYIEVAFVGSKEANLHGSRNGVRFAFGVRFTGKEMKSSRAESCPSPSASGAPVGEFWIAT